MIRRGANHGSTRIQIEGASARAIESFDVENLSGLRARPHTFEVGVFRGFVFGLTLALLPALFLFLLFLFTSAFSDSFFQVSSLPQTAGRAGFD